MPKDLNLNKHNNWSTPSYLYKALDDKYKFDFDPCPLFFGDIPDSKNGLLIGWGKRNFVNPPYDAKTKKAFVLKAIEESSKGNTSVMLLPVSTSTVLFHEYISEHADEIIFLKGRLRFDGVNTKNETANKYSNKASSMHDSMLVVFKGKKV